MGVMLKESMESDIASSAKLKEDEIEALFKATVPQLGLVRTAISIVVYLIVFAILREFDSSPKTWTITIILVGVLNIMVWKSIRKYRLAKFRESFNITRN